MNASSKDVWQFVKFSLVGCSNVFVSYIVFCICYEHWRSSGIFLNALGHLRSNVFFRVNGLDNASFEGAAANLAGYTIGMLNSFVWNKMWTFRALRSTTKQVKHFVLTNIVCLVLSTIIISIFVDIMKYPYKMVWVLSIGITTSLTFFCYKHWIFGS